MATGFFISEPVDYQVEKAINLEPVLDVYKIQTINKLDTRIAKNCSKKGRTFEYIYSDKNANPKSCVLDNVIIFRDNTVEHNKLCAISYDYVYENNKLVRNKYSLKKIMPDETINGTFYNGVFNETDSDYTFFGEVPIIEYINTEEKQGDYEPVISLIDAYNLLQSDRLNDKEQLVDAILCVYGMSMTPEQKELLKEKRMLVNIPPDAKIEYLTKALNEADNDVLRGVIEQDIHKISMVPNMSDVNFAGNSSGVAIKFKLLAFLYLIKNKERCFEEGLLDRFRMYNYFLNIKSNMPIIPTHEIDIVFKHSLPSNDLEIAQTISYLDGKVDNETLISQLSFIKDASEITEIVKKEKESNTMKYLGQFGDINNQDE